MTASISSTKIPPNTPPTIAIGLKGNKKTFKNREKTVSVESDEQWSARTIMIKNNKILYLTKKEIVFLIEEI